MSYSKLSRVPGMLGTSETDAKIASVVQSPALGTASAIALIFHGYKRTGSILWALAYGAVGRAVPLVAVPIAVAQGFGKRKACDS